jgi:hypothetical protein
MDPASRRRTWDTARELLRGGATVLLTTHYLEEAEALAHGDRGHDRHTHRATERRIAESRGQTAFARGLMIRLRQRGGWQLTVVCSVRASSPAIASLQARSAWGSARNELLLLVSVSA